MRCRPLHVEQRHALGAEALDEVQQGDLRRVGCAVEHRFACEEAADPHAVQATDEFTAEPDLDRLRPPEPEECAVGGADRLGDPEAVAPGISAGAHDIFERSVRGDGEPGRRSPQAPARMESVEWDDPPRIGRVPRDLRRSLSRLERHREQSGPIRREQRPRCEIGPDRDHVGPGLGRRRIGHLEPRRLRFGARWSSVHCHPILPAPPGAPVAVSGQ